MLNRVIQNRTSAIFSNDFKSGKCLYQIKVRKNSSRYDAFSYNSNISDLKIRPLFTLYTAPWQVSICGQNVKTNICV